MSEPLTDPNTGPAVPEPWMKVGFYGDQATAAAAKLLTDVDPRAGAWLPLPGEPPMLIDLESPETSEAMFAVFVRPYDPIPTPPGLKRATGPMLGRMVGG